MALRFTKMHGLGNDYVYVDGFTQDLRRLDAPELARRISDRHRGVGSDGLILIVPPEPGVAADVRMIMYNADGSRGEMCGNGIRCVAKYAVERGLVKDLQAASPKTHSPPYQGGGGGVGPSSPIPAELNTAVGGFLGDRMGLREVEAVDLAVQTDRGVLALTAFTSGRVVQSVRVDMGEPILEPGRIPVRAAAPTCVREQIDVAGTLMAMTCVSMGNPHAVFFVPNEAAVELERLGPIIERHEAFPNRVNVHFVECITPPTPPSQGGESKGSQKREASGSRVGESKQTFAGKVGEVRMRTWERGSGVTQACGTGACAVVVAGALEGRLDRRVLVHLPGGDLLIEWAGDNHVFKTGPAAEVFSGEWQIE